MITIPLFTKEIVRNSCAVNHFNVFAKDCFFFIEKGLKCCDPMQFGFGYDNFP